MAICPGSGAQRLGLGNADVASSQGRERRIRLRMKTQAIIVPEYKFVYVVIPKAACGSMKDAIVKILGLEWRGKLM